MPFPYREEYKNIQKIRTHIRPRSIYFSYSYGEKKEEPFQVNELTFSDFYDLKLLAEESSFHTTKNVNGHEIKVSEIKLVECKEGREYLPL